MLVTGVVTVLLGLAVALDEGGHIELGFAYAGPALLAAAGAILLASGLAARRRTRDHSAPRLR
jgi:hypothetical protein